MFRTFHVAAFLFICGSGLLRAGELLPEAVWGLQRDDSFFVETEILKETEIVLADAAPVISKSQHRFVVHYTVLDAGSAETLIAVRLSEVQQLTDTGPAVTVNGPALHRIRAVAAVEPTGIFKSITGLNENLSQVVATDERSADLLEQLEASDTISSWIEMPFFLTPSGSTITEKDRWERILDSSFGALGKLRLVLTFEISEVEKEKAEIDVSANGRFIPHAGIPHVKLPSLSFSESLAELNSFSGHGTILTEAEAEGQSYRRRPWFESMELTSEASGSGDVAVNGKSRRLSFHSRQTIKARMRPGYRIALPVNRESVPIRLLPIEPR